MQVRSRAVGATITAESTPAFKPAWQSHWISASRPVVQLTAKRFARIVPGASSHSVLSRRGRDRRSQQCERGRPRASCWGSSGQLLECGARHACCRGDRQGVPGGGGRSPGPGGRAVSASSDPSPADLPGAVTILAAGWAPHSAFIIAVPTGSVRCIKNPDPHVGDAFSVR